MKKKICSLALALLMCLSSLQAFAVKRDMSLTAAGAGENVLGFGTFDSADDAKMFLSQGARVTWMEEDADGRANSGCIALRVNEQWGYAYIDFPNIIGETYTISFYARTDTGTPAMEYIPYFTPTSGKTGWDTSILVDKFNTQWTKYECTYYCDGLAYNGTENTTRMRHFGIRIGGGAAGYTFYLDNLSIVPNGDIEYDWSLENFSSNSLFYDDVIPADDGFATPQPYDTVSFLDMDGHWGESAVETLASAGLLSGHGDGTFAPDSNVTRAEYIQMAMNLLRLETTPYKGIYKDVSASDWYADTIQAAYEVGMIPPALTVGGTIKPNQVITREEAATIMLKVAESRGETPETKDMHAFADNCRITAWAKDGVYSAAAFGIIEGYPDGTFGPKNGMTRAEAAAVMYRTVEIGGKLAVYVDGENGSDDNDGTKDAPVKTVDAARKLIQPYLQDMENHIFVLIKEGTYHLDAPTYWTSADSGQNGFSVIYKSLNEEQPVFDMASEHTGFRLYDKEKNIYRTYVGTNNNARQVFIDGVRGTRARGDFVARGSGETDWSMVDYTYYECEDSSYLGLTNQDDVELIFYENWTNPRISIQKIEQTDEGKIRFVPKNLKWNTNAEDGYAFPSSRPVYVENAYELIDVPGEWYINKKDGYLYYKLREYDNPETMVASLPMVEGAFFVAGESPDKKIHHLKFDNLAFQYSAWSYPATVTMYDDHQANEILNYPGDGRLTGSRETAALTLCDAAYVDVTSCTFAHMGGSGLGLREIYQHVNVTGNHIYDVSGSGLTIGAAVKEDDGSLFTTYFKPKNYKHYRIYNTFNNNLIHDYGVDYKGSVGLHSSPGLKESEICHNEIYGAAYTGIHFGWEWATRDVEGTGTRDVKVDENYVHDVLNTWIYDGACMYFNGATGASAENPISISRNYMENISNGTAQLYLDNGTYFYEATENVFENRDYTKDVYPLNNIGKTVDAPRWLYLQWDSHDNHVHDNYVQKPAYATDTSNGASVLESTVDVDGEWPQEAQEIIDNAGLESAYLAAYPDSVQKIDLKGIESHTFVNVGETYTLDVRGGMRKMKKVEMEPEELMFSSSNESVATVDANGVVTATGLGRCYIYADYLDGDVIRTASLEIASGDSVEKVTTDAAQYNIVAGYDTQLETKVTTKFGGTIALTSAEYVVEDPSVVTVSDTGVMTGLSDGTTIVTGIFEVAGETFETSFPVTVVSYTQADSEKHEETSTKHTSGAFFAANSWTVGAQKMDDGVRIAHSQPSYYKKKLENELISFDLTINNPNDWPSLALRASDSSGDYTNSKTYLIGFKKDYFEVQRFDSGARTMLFGESSFSPIYGAGAPNELNGEQMFAYGKRYSITVGAIDEAEGVRIVLIVNGKPVYDFVDKAEGHISGSGYFGVYAFNGDFTIQPFTGQKFAE